MLMALDSGLHTDDDDCTALSACYVEPLQLCTVDRVCIVTLA